MNTRIFCYATILTACIASAANAANQQTSNYQDALVPMSNMPHHGQKTVVLLISPDNKTFGPIASNRPFNKTNKNKPFNKAQKQQKQFEKLVEKYTKISGGVFGMTPEARDSTKDRAPWMKESHNEESTKYLKQLRSKCDNPAYHDVQFNTEGRTASLGIFPLETEFVATNILKKYAQEGSTFRWVPTEALVQSARSGQAYVEIQNVKVALNPQGQALAQCLALQKTNIKKITLSQ